MKRLEACRAAMIVESYPNLTETFIRRQAEGIGAEVLALAPSRSGEGAGSGTADAAPLHAIAGEPGSALALLARIDHALHARLVAPADERAWTWGAIRRARLAGRLREIRARVALAQYGHVGLAALPACERAGVPLVVHFHGHDLSRMWRDPAYRAAMERAARRFAGFVVVNSIMAERLASVGVPEERVARIPYGAPLEEFAPVASEVVVRAPCDFLAVGRMVEKKAPLETLRAFAACVAHVELEVAGNGLDGSGPPRLAMLGDGPLLEPARALVREWGFAEIVELPGAVSNDEVRRRMSAASGFVQHSVVSSDGDEEGWPVAVGEAMACGLPVVATRHPGIVDQVAEGETGFLVDEGDYRAMGARMATLVTDPALRVRMGAAARSRIERLGDARHQIARLQDFLESVARPASR